MLIKLVLQYVYNVIDCLFFLFYIKYNIIKFIKTHNMLDDKIKQIKKTVI